MLSRHAQGRLHPAAKSSCVAAHAEQACTRQAEPSSRAEHVLQLRQSKHARLSNITALCCCFNNIRACAAGLAEQASTRQAVPSCRAELCCSSCRAGMLGSAAELLCVAASTTSEHVLQLRQSRQEHGELGSALGPRCAAAHAELAGHTASCAQQPSRAVLQLRQGKQAHGQLGSATWSSCVAAHAEQACTRQAVPSRRAEHVLQLRQSKHARLSNITALCCCFNNIRACAAGLAEQASTRQAVPSSRAELCCSSGRAGRHMASWAQH